MKKSFSQLIVLFLATLILTGSKTVATDVPLRPIELENEKVRMAWSSMIYSDGMLCKNEDFKFPMLSTMSSSKVCTYEEQSKNEYSYLSDVLFNREMNLTN